MGEYKDPSWYDEYYRKNTRPELGWIHDEVARHIVGDGSPLTLRTRCVFDFGCGPGWFEQRLRAAGYGDAYVGVDTSIVAIEKAMMTCTHPDSLFLVDGSFSTVTITHRGEVTPAQIVYTILETLEHLEDDVATFRRIVPIGGRVIISVPTYDSESHVRFFTAGDDLCARYGLGGQSDGGLNDCDAIQYVKNKQIYVIGIRER